MSKLYWPIELAKIPVKRNLKTRPKKISFLLFLNQRKHYLFIRINNISDFFFAQYIQNIPIYLGLIEFPINRDNPQVSKLDV